MTSISYIQKKLHADKAAQSNLDMFSCVRIKHCFQNDDTPLKQWLLYSIGEY